MAVLMVACGVRSAHELADSLLPPTEAQELLEDYQFQIEARLTYSGDNRFLARSAEIRERGTGTFEQH